MTGIFQPNAQPLAHVGASKESRDIARAFPVPTTLNWRVWYVLMRESVWEAVAQRPPLERELTDSEHDARDWGLALGLAIGLARAEEPCETFPSVLERALSAALWWIERGGSTGEPGLACHDCGRDTSTASEVWRSGDWYGADPREIADYYWVNGETWAAAGGGTNRVWTLCLGCLQKRLGRPLELSDFPMFPENRHPRRLIANGGIT